MLLNGQELYRQLLAEGPAPIPCDSGKGVNRSVDRALGKQHGDGAREPAGVCAGGDGLGAPVMTRMTGTRSRAHPLKGSAPHRRGFP